MPQFSGIIAIILSVMSGAGHPALGNASFAGGLVEFNARRQADAIMLRDARRAEAELTRRLLAAIEVRDRFLIVRDPLIADIDMAIMPKNTPWVAHCGMGFLIAFGGETPSAAIEVELTDADIDLTTCESLAPRLASAIRAVLAR